MMEMGQSQPWPRGAGGLHRRDRAPTPRAVADYFAPLNAWLTKQNKGEKCGW